MWLTRRVIGLLLLAPGLAALYGESHAGECTRSDDQNLAILEHWSGRSIPDSSRVWIQVSNAFYCLTYNQLDYRKWAGPNAAAYFRGLHESPLRDRVVAACRPYLGLVPGNGSPAHVDFALQAASTLAMYGEHQVGGYDVLALLVRRTRASGCGMDYLALASLGDVRVLGVLTTQYDSLRTMPLSRNIHYERIQIVNCLYHVPGDSVLPFLRMISETDPDIAVVARARYVLAQRRP